MGKHKKGHGICPRGRLTSRWSLGIPPSIRRRSRMKRKYNYYELEGSKDKEGHDREASISKSAGKLKRKIKEGRTNDNALSASCFGLFVEGKVAQIDGKGSPENEGC